jgi:hypothetical protein
VRRFSIDDGEEEEWQGGRLTRELMSMVVPSKELVGRLEHLDRGGKLKSSWEDTTARQR